MSRWCGKPSWECLPRIHYVRASARSLGYSLESIIYIMICCQWGQNLYLSNDDAIWFSKDDSDSYAVAIIQDTYMLYIAPL